MSTSGDQKTQLFYDTNTQFDRSMSSYWSMAKMYDIKAIETEYNGVTFRSRLEARWAVFFDKLGISWMYEYEGYQTPTEYYIPDFWLPDVYMRDKQFCGVLVEVKPDNYEPYDHEALAYVSSKLNVGAMLVKGFYPDNDFGGDGLIQVNWWDAPMMLCKCPKCKAVKFEFPEGSYDDCPNCHAKVFRDGNPLVVEARRYAINYRFW